MSENIFESLKDLIQVKSFNLANGEPFAIVIKSDDMDVESIDALKKGLESNYSNMGHRVAVMCVGKDDDVDFFTLKELTEKAVK